MVGDSEHHIFSFTQHNNVADLDLVTLKNTVLRITPSISETFKLNKCAVRCCQSHVTSMQQLFTISIQMQSDFHDSSVTV